jgi:hypothetical protein
MVTSFPVIGSRMVMGQFSLVQAQDQRRACRFRSVAIGIVVTRQLLNQMLTSPKQIEAVHPRPDCFGGEGRAETQRISQRMVAATWLTDC